MQLRVLGLTIGWRYTMSLLSTLQQEGLSDDCFGHWLEGDDSVSVLH